MSISSTIGRIAVPIAVALVFFLARRLLPATSIAEVTMEDAERFSQLQWLIAGRMIGIGVVFAFTAYEALLLANKTLALRDGPSLYLIIPSRWMWFFFPFFGALCLTWEIALRAWTLIGDKIEAHKYESWSNAKTGFNATRVLRLMTLAIALPIGFISLMALPMHTSINETGIRIGHFAALTATYRSYSDIRKIVVVKGMRLRDGRVQKRPSIILSFADGSSWSSADNRDPQPAIDSGLLTFLQNRTVLPVEYVDALTFYN